MRGEKPKEERESAAAEKRPTTKEERYELAENASRIVSCLQTRVSSGFRTVAPRRQAFEAPTARRPRRPLWLPHASVSSTHPPSLGPLKGREKTDASRMRFISKASGENRRNTTSGTPSPHRFHLSFLSATARRPAARRAGRSRGASVASTNSSPCAGTSLYTRNGVQ